MLYLNRYIYILYILYYVDQHGWLFQEIPWATARCEARGRQQAYCWLLTALQGEMGIIWDHPPRNNWQ